MPFQSEKQRRYMHANLPEIAKRWERDYATGGISNHFRKKLGDGTSLSDYLETPKYLDAYSQAHDIGAKYPSNILQKTDKYAKQGTSSDVRHTLGSAATKEALIDWVSNKIGVDPYGKVADVIGNLGITAATATEEIPDAWRSVKQAFKEKDYGAITSGNVFAQPWEDVKANLNVWGIPYGASLEEKIAAAVPTEDEFWGDRKMSAADRIQTWKDRKQKNIQMMTFAEAKAKADAKVKADAAAAAQQVRQNIQTYGNRDRPDTGMNEPGGGRGQSPTGGNVAGTPFNRGGVARKNYYHGGILDINESEEIIDDGGNEIELTDYNAAFDDPNDFSNGVKSLFRAKEGGNVRLGPHTATDLLAKKNPDGTRSKYQPPGHRDAPAPSSRGPRDDPDRSGQPSTPSKPTMRDVAGPIITPKTVTPPREDAREQYISTLTYPKKYQTVERHVPHTDQIVKTQIRDYYDPKGYQKRAPKTKEEKSLLDKIAWGIGIYVTGGALLGYNVPKGVITAQKILSKRSEINTALKYAKKLGLFKEEYTVDQLFDDQVEKMKANAKERKDKMDEYESLPIGHPDRVALEIELEIGKKPEHLGDDGGPQLPDVVPIGEEVQEYEEMAPESMSLLAQIRSRQALNAQLQQKWADEKAAQDQLFITANRGGLANLFRVKNQ